MATTLTRAYLAELKKGENRSNVILEVEFDSGTKRYGYSRGGLNDFTQGLLAIYRLDNDWLATIGGANGTSIGAGFDAVNHKLGIGCGSFNGTGDHVDMGSISGSDVLSFAFWFKPNAAITSASAFQDPVRFGNVGGLYYAAMLGSATSDLTDEIFTIYCRDSANSPAPHGWVDNFFTIDTTWHLVVCVWNSAVNMYDIYFDGDSKTVTNGSTGRTSLPVIANNFSLGQHNASGYFGGLVDEVVLWDRTLSAVEISQLYNGGRGIVIDSIFTEVVPILKSVSSLQNKLDPTKAIGTRGQASFTISGRDNFKNLIRDEYIKNRRVVFKSGFVADGYAYSDYVEFYTGLISDWSRRGDELTITVADDLAAKATIKIPVLTHDNLLSTTLNYQNQNPVDIILDIVLASGSRTNDITGKDNLDIPLARVDQANMLAERDDWIPGLIFDRVLVESKSANKYLNELQVEAGCFLFHTGQKIDLKIFAPIRPGVTVDTLTDEWHIIRDSLTQNSGYLNNFFNRIVIYSDYDESGGDDASNYEYAVVAADVTSQSAGAWDEVKTKEIKCKWVRSRTYTQPSDVTGVTIYHMSRANGVGTGNLDWDVASQTLRWRAPAGVYGGTIELSEDGRFQLFDANNQASIRVVVDFSLLPGLDKDDDISISSLAGDNYSQTLASRAIRRFRNPVTSVKWSVDINEINNGTKFRKPGDFIKLTTDEAFEYGEDTWVGEGLMLTSVRSDFTKRVVAMEAVETKFTGSAYNNKIGFIGAAATMASEYDSATDDDKNYAYICDTPGLTLGTVTDPANVVW